jgi:glucose-1-phosphate cytidylyltransferase
MQVVILAGGYGSRISEYTKLIPKPMIKINKKPIISHIIDIYQKYGVSEFLIATGYKGKIIENYFKKSKINITCVDTGKDVMTGGRLKRLEKYINGTFMLTYGDGLSNVNISKLIRFHNKNNNICTVTAVRPPARFGEILFGMNNLVKKFKEKPQTNKSWINGGYFVMEKNIFKYLKNDKTVLENEPLENLAKEKKLSAYKHYDFWHCVDTVRDKEAIEKIIKKNKLYPWL